VRHLHLRQALIAITGKVPVAGRRELAAPVQRHHGAFVERRGEERARLVREVVLDELPLPTVLALGARKALADVVRRAVQELALGVNHIGEGERLPGRGPVLLGSEARRFERQRQRKRVVLEERRWIVGVRDAVHVGQLGTGGLEAIVDRVERQLPHGERQRALAVLDARKALLLGGGDDGAIAHQAGGGIVEGGVDAKRDHAASSGCLFSCSSSSAAAATVSGATLRRQSWWPAGQTLL